MKKTVIDVNCVFVFHCRRSVCHFGENNAAVRPRKKAKLTVMSIAIDTMKTISTVLPTAKNTEPLENSGIRIPIIFDG